MTTTNTCFDCPSTRIFNLFCSRDLDLDLLTFIYELDPYFFEMYRSQNEKNELLTSRISKVIVWQTDRTEIIYHATSPAVKNDAAQWTIQRWVKRPTSSCRRTHNSSKNSCRVYKLRMLSSALTETFVVPVVENFTDSHHKHGRLRFAVLILHRQVSASRHLSLTSHHSVHLYRLLSELWHCLTLSGGLAVFWLYATLIIFVHN